MEITLYEGKKINSVGQTYEKEIKDTLAPIIQKSYKNKIKRSEAALKHFRPFFSHTVFVKV